MTSILILALVLSGCTQNNEEIQNLENKISNLESDNNQLSQSIKILEEENNRLEEKFEYFNKSIYSCESDDDCILTIAGCNLCPTCKSYKITDPEVISVNKNLYSCPPKPDDLVCAACVSMIDYDPQDDAICVDTNPHGSNPIKRCEKKL